MYKQSCSYDHKHWTLNNFVITTEINLGCYVDEQLFSAIHKSPLLGIAVRWSVMTDVFELVSFESWKHLIIIFRSVVSKSLVKPGYDLQ